MRPDSETSQGFMSDNPAFSYGVVKPVLGNAAHVEMPKEYYSEPEHPQQQKGHDFYADLVETNVDMYMEPTYGNVETETAQPPPIMPREPQLVFANQGYIPILPMDDQQPADMGYMLVDTHDDSRNKLVRSAPTSEYVLTETDLKQSTDYDFATGFSPYEDANFNDSKAPPWFRSMRPSLVQTTRLALFLSIKLDRSKIEYLMADEPLGMFVIRRSNRNPNTALVLTIKTTFNNFKHIEVCVSFVTSHCDEFIRFTDTMRSFCASILYCRNAPVSITCRPYCVLLAHGRRHDWRPAYVWREQRPGRVHFGNDHARPLPDADHSAPHRAHTRPAAGLLSFISTI